MRKVKYSNGYIHMYAVVACDECLEAFHTCDVEVYLWTFDGEELQADCPYCGKTVYVEAYFSDFDETV